MTVKKIKDKIEKIIEWKLKKINKKTINDWIEIKKTWLFI